MLKQLASSNGITNIDINALVMYTSSIEGSAGLYTEGTSLTITRNGTNHNEVEFRNTYNPSAVFTPLNGDYKDLPILYNPDDVLIKYASDVKIPTSLANNKSSTVPPDTILINNIFTCYILNYNEIKKYIKNNYNDFYDIFDQKISDEIEKDKNNRIASSKNDLIKKCKELPKTFPNIKNDMMISTNNIMGRLEKILDVIKGIENKINPSSNEYLFLVKNSKMLKGINENVINNITTDFKSPNESTKTAAIKKYNNIKTAYDTLIPLLKDICNNYIAK